MEIPDWEWWLTPRDILGPFWFAVWLISMALFGVLTMIVLLRLPKPQSAQMPTTNETVAPAAPASAPATSTVKVDAPVSAPVTQITGNTGTVNVSVVHPTYRQLVDDPASNIQASVEEVKLDTPEGRRANIKVYMLWQDASWKPREAAFNNEEKLRSFLRGSLLQEAMGTAHVIGCIGLASNEMKPELQSATADRKEQVLGTLSDKRAFQLCRLLADNARTSAPKSRFVGVGIGYHTKPALDRTQDLRQRGVAFVRINATSGAPFDKQGVENIIRGLVEQTTLFELDFKAYSRVAQKRPICWVQMETGVFTPECKA